MNNRYLVVSTLKSGTKMRQSSWLYIQDILFWIVSGLIIIFVIMKYTNGEIRIYMVLGIILGILIYFLIISKYIMKIFVCILSFLLNYVNIKREA